VTIVRVGTNQKYSQGWEAAFAKGKKKQADEGSRPASKKRAAVPPSKKRAAVPSSKKKSARRAKK